MPASLTASKTDIVSEQGVYEAMGRSRMIALVISRDAVEAIKGLKESEPCDEFLLQMQFAWALQKTKGTLVVPIFVGNCDKVLA